jgi:molybdenum cofactor cytidylyltransferase
MEFGPISVAAAEGAILAHAVRAGEALFKKGRVLSASDVALLRAAGIDDVVAARLVAGDVGEDEAAARIARAAAGTATRIGAAFTGRANLYAMANGLAVIDAERIAALNRIDESLTLATLAPFARVTPRQMLATIKVIPFAAPEKAVAAAEALLASGPVISVAPFRPHRAALISTASSSTKPSLLDKNRAAIAERLESVGSRLVLERRTPHEPELLAAAIADASAAGADPIMIFGASAITDRRDVIPTAVKLAGGTVEHFGMPVDPGNLLLTGRIGGATIVGLPGCARSPKLNGFDYVLWRIAAGLPADGAAITAMGVGGLLAEIPTRPQPRDERPTAAPHMPKIGAIVLAAGLSSRMGSNKLLASVGGRPLIRHAAEAAVGSAADPVIVVTGNAGEAVTSALTGLPLRTIKNPDFAKGLSSSLKSGLNALPEDCDGALILLGDMPDISAALLDKMIAAFDPEEERAICVATRRGKRGNPVLWARRFFPEMLALDGDVGAKHLVALYGELVCEVEADDDGPLTDIDTPEALAAYQAK